MFCALAMSAPPRQTMTTVVISPVMPNIRMAPTAMIPSTTAAAPTETPSVENWPTAAAQPIVPPACTTPERITRARAARATARQAGPKCLRRMFISLPQSAW